MSLDMLPVKEAPAESQLSYLVNVLEGYRYRFAHEMQLHAGIAAALCQAQVAFEQERKPVPSARYDFWCTSGNIVIEAKVHGSYAAALRQVDRYLQLPDCQAVVIASTRRWAFTAPAHVVLRHKPVLIAKLRPQSF